MKWSARQHLGLFNISDTSAYLTGFAPSRCVAALIMMCVGGCWARLLYLGRKSYWWDEVATVKICTAPLREFWNWLWIREANMTFYYLIVRQWIRLGEREASLRSLSVIFAVISIPLMYLVAVRAFASRRAGLWAALLLTINTAHIAYSQEARSYTLLVLLCLFSLLFFLQLPHSGTANAVAYVVVSALSVYTHFFGVFFLGAQWCSLFFLRKENVRWRQVFWSIAVVILLITPALYYMLFRNSGQLAYTPPIMGKDLLRLLNFLAADGGRYHRALALFYLLCIANAVWGLLAGWKDCTRSQINRSSVVMICCVLIPVLVTFLLSFWMSMFAMPYLLICLSPFLLLAAEGLSEISWKWLQVTVAGCIVLLSMGALRCYYAHPKDDWRGMADYVLQHYGEGDAVVGCPAGVEWPFRYYVSRNSGNDGLLPAYITPSELEANVTLHRTASKPLGASRFWVLTWGATCDHETFSRMTPEYERVEERAFGGGVALALYAKSAE